MIRVLVASVLVVVLNACSNQRWDPNDYPVRSGDTIYSIAWKYELDPFELASWNNLSSPYRIYPGQRLNMRPEGSAATAAGPASSTTTRSTGTKPDSVTVRKGDTLYAIARQHDMSMQQLASINGLRSPYTIRPGQTLKLQSSSSYGSSPATSTTPKSKSTSRAATASLPQDNSSFSWQWPVHGKLITTFKSNKTGRKGIDIAGTEGKTIKAAAPGKVVYSGNGLISYGNLVIIKHNRTYLSAYAHNRKLLVKEGDSIKAGQKIAELGKTGTDSPRLHFEIRKNGKPVNPLKYLPSS
jgi:lipoprotein NlpD